jgi:ketosteroid isomerase-like protein
MIASMVGLHLRLRGRRRVDNALTVGCAEIARSNVPSFGEAIFAVFRQVRQYGGRRRTRAGKIMTRAEIEAIIRKLYAARVAADIPAIMPYATPDVEFVLAGDPGASPVAGRLHGTDALRPQLEKLFAAFKFNSYDIVTLVVEGSNAAVRARASLTSNITGATVDMEFGDFFTFKDGRVASFVQFCDTALAGKLLTKP